MTILKHKPHPDEAALPGPATKHAPPARHLTGIKRVDHTPLSYADVEPEPEDKQAVTARRPLDHAAVAAEVRKLRRDTDRAMHDTFQPPAATGVPYGARLRTVPLATIHRDETPVADLLARIGLVYAKRGITAAEQIAGAAL